MYYLTETIFRLKSDGSDIIRLTSDGGKPFAVDDNGTIYYTSSTAKIKSMNMDGENVRSLDVGIDPKSAIAVDDSYVYYVPKLNNTGNLILRAGKYNGEFDEKFAIYGSDAKITKLVNLKQRQDLKKDNPCNLDKENCVDGLCFMIPQDESKTLQCKGFEAFQKVDWLND